MQRQLLAQLRQLRAGGHTGGGEQQLGGAGTTSGYLFLIPLFTALMSVPALGATFSPVQLLGGVSVGIAVWLMSRAKN